MDGSLDGCYYYMNLISPSKIDLGEKILLQTSYLDSQKTNDSLITDDQFSDEHLFVVDTKPP
jgi:hypothetical protein